MDIGFAVSKLEIWESTIIDGYRFAVSKLEMVISNLGSPFAVSKL
jgi:hypothetical protein